MTRLVERNVPQLAVEMDERARGSADDWTVRVRAARRVDTILLTFSVEVSRKNRGLHPGIRVVLVRVGDRFQVLHGNFGARVVGDQVRNLASLSRGLFKHTEQSTMNSR